MTAITYIQRMKSGSTHKVFFCHNLVSCCTYTYSTFAADHLSVILWLGFVGQPDLSDFVEYPIVRLGRRKAVKLYARW